MSVQESELSQATRQLTSAKARVLEGVASFVTCHRSWIIPAIHIKYFPQAKIENIRSAMVALSDSGLVIKVITRHMPECLRLRPPSWLDLSKENFAASEARPQMELDAHPMNPQSHFIPSPRYVESCLSVEQRSTPDMRWLLEESSRVWRELLREEIREQVRTNVPTTTAATIEKLTTALLEIIRHRPDVRAERARGVIVSSMKQCHYSGTLDESQCGEVLQLALRNLNHQLGSEVQARFSPFARSGWRF